MPKIQIKFLTRLEMKKTKNKNGNSERKTSHSER